METQNPRTNDTLCIRVEELSRTLGIGITNAYKLSKRSDFYPAKRIEGRIVINVDLLKKWLSEQNK